MNGCFQAKAEAAEMDDLTQSQPKSGPFHGRRHQPLRDVVYICASLRQPRRAQVGDDVVKQACIDVNQAVPKCGHTRIR